MTKFIARRVVFLAAALLWLPLGIVASGAIRGFALTTDPTIWISLLPATLAGFPLAIACWLINRQRLPKLAWASFGILAPISTIVALPAGLLGPIGIILGASIVSLPAFAVFAFAIWKKKRSADDSHSY